MKTIFNTCVEVTSQEQADRLKQVCIDNGLPIWDCELAFEILPLNRFFQHDEDGNKFWVSSDIGNIKITESEWMELLEQHNKTKSKSDIINELIDYATTNDNLWLKNQLEKLR